MNYSSIHSYGRNVIESIYHGFTSQSFFYGHVKYIDSFPDILPILMNFTNIFQTNLEETEDGLPLFSLLTPSKYNAAINAVKTSGPNHILFFRPKISSLVYNISSSIKYELNMVYENAVQFVSGVGIISFDFFPLDVDRVNSFYCNPNVTYTSQCTPYTENYMDLNVNFEEAVG